MTHELEQALREADDPKAQSDGLHMGRARTTPNASVPACKGLRPAAGGKGCRSTTRAHAADYPVSLSGHLRAFHGYGTADWAQ